MQTHTVDASGNLAFDPSDRLTGVQGIADRIRKLKAQADGEAALGNVGAAEAFAGKVQQLLTQHKMTMSDVEITVMEAEDPIGAGYYQAEALGTHHRQTRVAWIERLADAVARSHFCRLVVIPKSSTISLVGRSQDREVASLLCSVLIRAVEGEATRGYADITNRLYPLGRQAECRGWKAAFINTAVSTIRLRLLEKTRSMAAEADARGTALVLRADKALDNYMKSGTYGSAGAVRGTRGYNPDGSLAGQTFGQNVNLSVNGLSGSSSGSRALPSGK